MVEDIICYYQILLVGWVVIHEPTRPVVMIRFITTSVWHTLIVIKMKQKENKHLHLIFLWVLMCNPQKNKMYCKDEFVILR